MIENIMLRREKTDQSSLVKHFKQRTQQLILLQLSTLHATEWVLKYRTFNNAKAAEKII